MLLLIDATLLDPSSGREGPGHVLIRQQVEMGVAVRIAAMASHLPNA